MELTVYNIKGEDTGRKVQLDDSIFGIEPNDHSIYLDVKNIRNNQRQGTHSAKDRSQLSGSTRKLKRQKGTGTARCGDIKNPLFRGGARVFGPRPHLYRFKLNKKEKQLARRSALAYKAQAERGLIVVEDFTFEHPKTKAYQAFLSDMKVVGRTLLLVPETNENVMLAARNVQKSDVCMASNVNTYRILNAKHLLVTESSLVKLSEMFAQ